MATVRIQLRRGTADQWDSANPILAAGEIGIETDTNTFKFGDGVTNWNDLSYALSDTVDDYIPLSEKGVALGVATLDASGYVPTSQLPPLAKITVNAVADQAARLALTVEPGDIAIQSDNGTTYVLQSSPASTDANWKEISATAAISAAVSAHESDTTNVHGISDTSILVTTTGTQTLTNKTITSPLGLVKSDVGLGNVDNTSDADKPISTSTQSALDLKAPLASPALTGVPTAPTATSDVNNTQIATTAFAKTVAATAQSNAEQYADNAITNIINSAPSTLDTLNELAAALGDDPNFATTITNSIATKAPIESPTFTGTVTLPGSTSIGDVSNLEIGYLNGVTSSVQGQINTKLNSTDAAETYAPIASPTFTGTVTLPASTTVGDVSNLEIGYLNGVTSSVQGQIDDKLNSADAASTYAPIASPTFTGTVTLPSTTDIGDVSSTEIGYLNGVTSSVQGQIDDKLNSADAASTYAPIASPTFTGTVTLPASTSVGDVSNLEIGYLNGVTSSVQGQIDLKAPLASPTFTGTVILPDNTVTGSMIADTTIPTSKIADTAITAAKLASSAVETAKINDAAVTTAKINDGAVTSAKIADGTIVNADINASAAIDWTKLAISSTVSATELGYVDGVTSAIQTQLDTKLASASAASTYAPLASPALTGTPTAPTATSGTNTTQVATTAFVTGAVNDLIASAPGALNTLDELAAALGDDANFATTVTNSIALKAPIASPTFTGTVTVAASGIAFTDGTQTKQGVPSQTTINSISASYNLSTGGLALRDTMVESSASSGITVTIPTNATTAYPVGTTIDFLQTGTGQITFAGASGVTVNGTPGLKTRAQWSSVSLFKRSTDAWVVLGDLTA